MAAIASRTRTFHPPKSGSATSDPVWVRWALIAITLGFFGLFLLMPLVVVFYEAFKQGVSVYLATFHDRFAVDAIKLTITVALMSVPLNLLFGLAAAWAITKYTYRGKSLLVTVLDLPFAVSPVIAGLIFVLLFSTTHGWFASFLNEHHIRIIFAVPGIVLATTFITLPFIARELVPAMQARGSDEEFAAMTLGAGGWRTFFHVTLPGVKWALFYGIILCNARAMGEFGAVAVVSGNVKGKTSTMPLYIETLYMEYNTQAAFALASVLTLLALVTLVLKNFIEWRTARAHAANQ
jgi:sulfate transport system permease protein